MDKQRWRRWYRLYLLFIVLGLGLLAGYYLWQPLLVGMVLGWVLIGTGLVMSLATWGHSRFVGHKDVWAAATRQDDAPSVYDHDYDAPGAHPRGVHFGPLGRWYPQ